MTSRPKFIPEAIKSYEHKAIMAPIVRKIYMLRAHDMLPDTFDSLGLDGEFWDPWCV